MTNPSTLRRVFNLIRTLNKYKPEIIIQNSLGAYIPNFEETPILMDAKETIKVAGACPHYFFIYTFYEIVPHFNKFNHPTDLKTRSLP